MVFDAFTRRSAKSICASAAATPTCGGALPMEKK
jgi:hypothetical protein